MAKSNVFCGGLIGLDYKNEFLPALVSSDNEEYRQIIAQEARLIPIGKKDDEMAMTTVFLSAMKYVREFRNLVSSPIGLSKGGSIVCYTEVSFPKMFSDDPDKRDSRFDGLVLVISSGKIKDAAIFEMKQGKACVEKDQIERYLSMANALKIPRIISISNQFVTEQTDYPIEISFPKKNSVNLYHYSWVHLLYFCRILIKDNGLNVSDIDQEYLLKEILKYYEDCGGVENFNKMSVAKWRDIAMDLGSTSPVLRQEFKQDLERIITDWIQEEKDIALKLSLVLSMKEVVNVSTESKKYPSVKERIPDDLDTLRNDRVLNSIFKISNAVSPMSVSVSFPRKNTCITMRISVPADKSSKGKIAYVRRYLKKAQSSNPDEFLSLQDKVSILIKPKAKKLDTKKYLLKNFMDQDSVVVEKEFEFNSVDVQMETDMGKDFLSSQKFIQIYENSIMTYYVSLMQYFEKWVPATPKAEKAVFANEGAMEGVVNDISEQNE